MHNSLEAAQVNATTEDSSSRLQQNPFHLFISRSRSALHKIEFVAVLKVFAKISIQSD